MVPFHSIAVQGCGILHLSAVGGESFNTASQASPLSTTLRTKDTNMPIPEYLRRLREKIGHALLMMPTADAVILNTEGHILLQNRTDIDIWTVPGGAIEPGEEPAEAVIREVKEETGLDVIPERIVGLYTFTGAYPNGDEVCSLSVTFACRVIGGTLQATGDETKQLRYFPLDALPDNVAGLHRQRVEHAVSREQPFFRLPER